MQLSLRIGQVVSSWIPQAPIHHEGNSERLHDNCNQEVHASRRDTPSLRLLVGPRRVAGEDATVDRGWTGVSRQNLPHMSYAGSLKMNDTRRIPDRTVIVTTFFSPIGTV